MQRPDIYEAIDQLRDELGAALDRLEAVESARQTQTWMNKQEAANYLRVSTATIDNMRGDGRLKTHYIGDRPIFRVDDLDAVASPDTDIRLVS